MKRSAARSFLLRRAPALLAGLLAAGPAPLHAQADAPVLTLPEMVITSVRGKVTRGLTADSGTAEVVPPAAPGQAFAPVKLPPGTRLDVDAFPTSHVVLALPGAGGCMVGAGASLRLPAANEAGMTVTFDRHITSPAKLFLNVSTAEMAKQGGKVFRFKNKFSGNRDAEGRYPKPKVIFTTTGGRFFVVDSQSVQTEMGGPSTNACTVGVFDGSMTVEEADARQQLVLKPGMALMIYPGKLGTPRVLTKQEAAWDIGCKLAVLGREVPARLPATMKTVAPTSAPGTKVNSLGMVFVPVPNTKVLMCVHETRVQDHAAFAATRPAPAAGTPALAFPHGLWGWEDHPVCTSWDEATAFCQWLSQKEGKTYRLPTDEEWSVAAGLSSRTKARPDVTPEELAKEAVEVYAWGTVWPPPAGVANLGDVSCFAEQPSYHGPDLRDYDDGFSETAPVMSCKPNKAGLYDMAGNVAEWCEDWFNASKQGRVVRGGNYRTWDRRDLGLSARKAFAPNFKFDTGFRVVLEVK